MGRSRYQARAIEITQAGLRCRRRGLWRSKRPLRGDLRIVSLPVRQRENPLPDQIGLSPSGWTFAAETSDARAKLRSCRFSGRAASSIRRGYEYSIGLSQADVRKFVDVDIHRLSNL